MWRKSKSFQFQYSQSVSYVTIIHQIVTRIRFIRHSENIEHLNWLTCNQTPNHRRIHPMSNRCAVDVDVNFANNRRMPIDHRDMHVQWNWQQLPLPLHERMPSRVNLSKRMNKIWIKYEHFEYRKQCIDSDCFTSLSSSAAVYALVPTFHILIVPIVFVWRFRPSPENLYAAACVCVRVTSHRRTLPSVVILHHHRTFNKIIRSDLEENYPRFVYFFTPDVMATQPCSRSLSRVMQLCVIHSTVVINTTHTHTVHTSEIHIYFIQIGLDFPKAMNTNKTTSDSERERENGFVIVCCTQRCASNQMDFDTGMQYQRLDEDKNSSSNNEFVQ